MRWLIRLEHDEGYEKLTGVEVHELVCIAARKESWFAKKSVGSSKTLIPGMPNMRQCASCAGAFDKKAFRYVIKREDPEQKGFEIYNDDAGDADIAGTKKMTISRIGRLCPACRRKKKAPKYRSTKTPSGCELRRQIRARLRGICTWLNQKRKKDAEEGPSPLREGQARFYLRLRFILHQLRLQIKERESRRVACPPKWHRLLTHEQHDSLLELRTSVDWYSKIPMETELDGVYRNQPHQNRTS